MPKSAYYKGKGDKVYADMVKRYGKKKADEVFYATANKRKMNPEDSQKKASVLLKVAAVLSAADRASVPKKDFAIPEKAEGKTEKKQSGNYPIPDRKHARAALSLVSMHGTQEEKARVRAKVRAKYPDMGKQAAVPDTGRIRESGTKFQYKVLGHMRDGTPLIATVSPSGTVQVAAMKGDNIRGMLYIGEDRKPKWTIPDQGDQEVAQAIERSFLEDPTVHPKWMLEEGRQRMEKASSGSYLDGYLNKAANDPEFQKKLLNWLMQQKSNPKQGQKYFENIVNTAPIDWGKLDIEESYIPKQVAKDKMTPAAVYATRWLLRGTPHLPSQYAKEKMSNPYSRVLSPKRRIGYNKAFNKMLPSLLSEIKKDPDYFNKMKYIMAGKKPPAKAPSRPAAKTPVKQTAETISVKP